ncbi:Protein bli-3 [Talaromyces islandicus]|uniref:Protein bli-3 n=1 Tax=Talaromyces islandicus TaxID=28573 RepID=A0A0U1M0X3_TALIS|nr:Protein bli-3 [Talaromyces islandicus]
MSFSTSVSSVDPYKSKNFESDVPLKEKIEDLVKFIKDTKYGMLTTMASDSELLTSRAMALAGTENGGVDLIFHTNLHSGKTMDLTVHPAETNVSFLDVTGSGWASISGTSSILAGREIIEKFYSPALKVWLGDLGDGIHDGSPSDPRIGVIKVEAKSAVHVLPRKGLVGRAVDAGKAIAKGDVPGINKIRELSTEELADWRQSHKE